MAKIKFNPLGDFDYNPDVHTLYVDKEEKQIDVDMLLLRHQRQEILDARRKPRKEYNRRREEGEAYFLSEEYLQSDELITELYPELFMSFEEYKKSNR